VSLVFIGLGSNLGDGRGNIRRAWESLGASPGVQLLALSSPYETEPVGIDSQRQFTNAAGALLVTQGPREFLELLLTLEGEMGRDRSKGCDRAIDLDILYFDDLIMTEPDLVLPHPEIAQRLFVLEPLTEVAPDHIHPRLQLSSKTMLFNLRGTVTHYIKKISWEE